LKKESGDYYIEKGGKTSKNRRKVVYTVKDDPVTRGEKEVRRGSQSNFSTGSGSRTGDLVYRLLLSLFGKERRPSYDEDARC